MQEPPVKKNGEYYGKFNILDTPCGRIVYTLAKAGYKLGVSSRGNGDYDEYTGEVDPETYDFTCFDVVLLPAVKSARMNLVTEGLEKSSPKKTFKTLLLEQLNRSTKEEKKIMKDTLKNIKENLDNKQEQDNFKKNNPKFNPKFNFEKFGKFFDKDGKLVDEKGYFEAAKNVKDDERVLLGESYEDEEKECSICHKKFKGWGNNAWPINDGTCCDECNWSEVIPARLKDAYGRKHIKEDVEDDIPNVEVEEDTLVINPETNEVEPKEVEETEEECPKCEEMKERLKAFFTNFLEKEGFEFEKEEDKEKLVDEFEEAFPELCDCSNHDECPDCNDKDQEVELDDEENQDVAADDIRVTDEEDLELLEQLQETLKENKSLKEEVRKLQEEKAVGNSKVTKLNEDLTRFKDIAANAGKKALSIKNFESENVKLSEKVNSLTEELKKARVRIDVVNKSTKTVEESFTRVSEENKKLVEKINALTSSSKKIEENYQKSVRLIEKYKKLANDVANRYIDNKALTLGVTSNEIKNRLNENYTLDEVDKVCGDLQQYTIKVNNLPFQVDTKPGKTKVKLREDTSRSPLRSINNQYDDTVDDFLLDLAGIKEDK